MNIIKEIKWTLLQWAGSILTYISPTLHIKLRYLAYNKKVFPENNPKTLSEKLLWLRIHHYNDSKFVIRCADKVKVREYVKAVGCGEYLNEFHGVYDSVDDVPWDSLPEQYAIKWNFGSGYNIICSAARQSICSDTNQLTLEQIKKTMKKWGKEEYWVPHAEMQYKTDKKQIIIEKYLGDDLGTLPSDYKLYCFNGKCRAIMYIAGREYDERDKCFFSTQWHYLGQARPGYPNPEEIVPAPKRLKEMIECAEKLSKDIPFVRIDLFEFDNRLYFGEMTFTPAAGFNIPAIALDNRDMGDYVDLSKEQLDKFKQLEADTEELWSGK